MRPLARTTRLAAALCLAAFGSARPADAVLSYASEAQDDPGSSTGAAFVALGVPDYSFVNDVGLGFGGTSSDVFGPGESTVLAFPVPLHNIAGQPDLIVSAFVGGTGATDNADVEVEVSSNGTNFVPVTGFSTAQARNLLYYGLHWEGGENESGFAGVKHFPIELGSADPVSHVRLRNASGTAEGLRLDAVEGLHPVTASRYAFQIRLEEYRDLGRFLVRLKNIAMPGGAPIRELRIIRPDDPVEPSVRLENTFPSLHAQLGQAGELLCVENCIFVGTQQDPVPLIPYSRHAWSLDGLVEAPAGTGLDPGRQAAHQRWENFDTDYAATFLAGFAFDVEFADGTVESFGFDADVLVDGKVGALYQKYMYFDNTAPQISAPQTAYFYEFVPEPSSGLSALAATLALCLLWRGRAPTEAEKRVSRAASLRRAAPSPS